VPATWSAEAANVFESTGRFTGVVREVAGTPYVVQDAGPPVQEDQPAEPADGNRTAANKLTTPPVRTEPPAVVLPVAQQTGAPAPAAGAPTSASNRQFFIAHGRDRTALAQLQSILKDLDIPYVVAEDEPNVGRPISQKIADLMRACSAGIFIFSGDEEVTDSKGEVVKRPRPNVVYELGAASLLYGQRIVIFKEAHVEFPTDFRDLGYIEYEKDLLSAKSMELLRELIKLRAVRVTPGG
jgi:predicted nucleotide-binding protein